MTNKEPKIIIGICTRDRPKMLTRLVKSLGASADETIKTFVVFNQKDPAIDIRGLLGGKIDICLSVERKLGLTSARNALFEIVKDEEFDYLLMIDDDNHVPKEYCSNLKEACEIYRNYDVISSNTIFTTIRPKLKAFSAEGSETERVYTNNVLISKKIVERFRFNEDFNFSGGEDVEFFKDVFLQDYTAVHTNLFPSFETVPEEKESLPYLIKRSAAVENNNRRLRKTKKSKIVLKSSFRAIELLLMLPFSLFFKKKYCKKIGKLYGGLLFIFDKKVELYKNVIGY